MNCKARGSDACWYRTILLSCLCLLIAFTAATAYGLGLDLSVTKDGPAQASDGGVITFTIDVQAAAADTGIYTETVTLTDTLPGGLDYMISSTLWGCDIGHPGNPGNYITVTIPLGGSEALVCERVMAGGDSAPLIITGTVNTQDPAFITNTVTVTGASGGGPSDSAGLMLNPQEPPIPTLNEWGMLVFSVLLAALAVVYLRSRRAT
jgi:hypothetical protein